MCQRVWQSAVETSNPAGLLHTGLHTVAGLDLVVSMSDLIARKGLEG